jgi:Tfp pilus assembly protein PilF
MITKDTQNDIFPDISSRMFVCLLLIVISFAVYFPVHHYPFTSYDDDVYVYKNQHVRSGITKRSVGWSFGFDDKDKTYWHPLTWLSHMLDVQLFGINPGRHHLTNLLFHMANTVLLFLVFSRMTAAIWPSALVAALFAVHPINVDSVAWIAERKNVLSSFFWMLTVLVYTVYVKRPDIWRYGAVLLAFALGLLTKPMLVTLPFVLLLLDYWPLGRIGFRPPRAERAMRVILEKVPLLMLSGLSVVLSSASVKGMGNVTSFISVPLSLRIANGLVSYVKYVAKLLWPQNLAVFYPYPKMLPLGQVIGALILLMGLSVLILRAMRDQPYLIVGWLWYLGTLIPVIGLVQVGLWPAMADRWAYVPSIGIFIMIAWGAADLAAKWRYGKIGLAFTSALLGAALMIMTAVQVQYWADNVSLYEHAIDVTGDNYVAHNNLGVVLAEQKKPTAAKEQYTKAIQIKPNFATAHFNLGVVLEENRRLAEALMHYAEAIRINPAYVEAHNNLANGLVVQGKITEAIEHYAYALKLNPDDPELHNNLGVALMKSGQAEQAIENFKTALRIKPDYFAALKNLRLALNTQRMP